MYSDKALFKNLLVVSSIWVVTSFTYYLIIFKLKSLPGDIYLNSCAASIANAFGHLSALLLYKVMHVRRSMIFYFIVQVLGSIPLCM